ncbi:PREDICTED: uncharacterized protein LOC108771634 [Cyphomyrmex costatus]|uniref:uncharacterized protein LOC108771634 n=1 Tax=Cyphomyrmex costatus TaxID=456900 RepID=UPI0008523CD2|nr:PREDICTED: uncharacterized protein LOC108771634 [Cyphomyrmex costatus]
MKSFSKRYRLQEILLNVLGLWPYNNTMYQRIQRIFFSILILFSILLQIKKLIDEINYHWNSTKCKEELKILQQYSYITKLLTIMVTGILYSSLCIFVMIQILPKFLDIVLPLNESRPLKLLGLATFFFDQEKYFIPIMMHMIIALLVESSTIIATETTTLFTTFCTREYSMELLLKILAYSVPWLSYVLRYNVHWLNTKKMQDLIERVRFDWNELSNAHELEIIKKYSAIGRLITLFTTLFAYLAIFSFILVQLLLNFVLDIATTTNESRIRHLTAEIEVFIDQQKYFTPLLLYMFLVVLCGITTVIAMETLLVATETIHMSYTHHACGLFEIASYRIEQTLLKDTIQNIASSSERSSIICRGVKKLIEQVQYDWNSLKKKEELKIIQNRANIGRSCTIIMLRDYRIECIVNRRQTNSLVSLEKFINHKSIVEAVNSHRNAIEFIDSVKSTYSVAHVFGSPVGVVSLSINLYLIQQPMVRDSIEHAKKPHNDNVSKYEDLHIDDLFWTIHTVFGRFCCAHQQIIIILYGTLFCTLSNRT